MVLKNHIAYRFLTDDSLALEMVETTYPKEIKQFLSDKDEVNELDKSKVATLFQLVSKDNQKAYYVTDTVISKLSLLKINKLSSGQYDWSVFKNQKDLKYTFILPPIDQRKGGGCLRMKIQGDVIEFVHISFQYKPNDKDYGTAYWVMFYVDRIKNIQCDHFAHIDVKLIEEFVYKLLCFVFLSENYEETLKAGEKKGTRKNGKIINTLPIPLTIINSKWNITSIRTEGFGVSGHFAIRWTGVGRTVAKMVFINPFEKHGYIRKAANQFSHQ